MLSDDFNGKKMKHTACKTTKANVSGADSKETQGIVPADKTLMRISEEDQAKADMPAIISVNSPKITINLDHKKLGHNTNFDAQLLLNHNWNNLDAAFFEQRNSKEYRKKLLQVDKKR